MSATTGQLIITISIIILCGMVLFILLREFMCWYWKINEMRNLLKQILDKLSDVGKVTEPIIKPISETGSNEPVGMNKIGLKAETSPKKKEGMETCKKCGLIKKKGEVCPHCAKLGLP